jgi:hypothetical protein
MGAMIVGMFTTLRSRLAALLRELRAGYPTLLFVGGLGMAVLVGRVAGGTSEAAFRYGGTLLEFFGIVLVAFGLDQTRAVFGKPTLTARARAWGTSVVASLKRRDQVVIIGSAGLALGGSSLVAFGSATLADQSVETRLTALEQDLRKLREEVKTEREAVRTEVAAVRSSVETVEKKGREQMSALEQRLDEFAAGGLVLEWIGLWWLLAGTLTANLSTELANVWTRLV